MELALEFRSTISFFPQALLAGFSFRTGEHKAFAVRKIAAKPEKVSILHKIALGIALGNLLGNLPGAISAFCSKFNIFNVSLQ